MGDKIKYIFLNLFFIAVSLFLIFLSDPHVSKKDDFLEHVFGYAAVLWFDRSIGVALLIFMICSIYRDIEFNKKLQRSIDQRNAIDKSIRSPHDSTGRE